MSDRIASDHPSVETVRATIKRHGAGKRLEVDDPIFPESGTIRLEIDGETRFAAPRERTRIPGAYASPSFARAPGGKTDYLGQWLDSIERIVGHSVELDIIEPDVAYGVREPGTTTIYTGIEGPDPSLASIAEDLDS